jgi:hypothetical protein
MLLRSRQKRKRTGIVWLSTLGSEQLVWGGIVLLDIKQKPWTKALLCVQGVLVEAIAGRCG